MKFYKYGKNIVDYEIVNNFFDYIFEINSAEFLDFARSNSLYIMSIRLIFFFIHTYIKKKQLFIAFLTLHYPAYRLLSLVL